MRPLELQDIYKVNPNRSVKLMTQQFQAQFETALARGGRHPLFWALYETFKFEFWLGGFCSLVSSVLQILSPFTTRYLIQFATDANPMARIAYNLYKGKFLTAVSVGFIPLRWEDGTEKTGYTRKYLEQELLEVSAVAIPANPNALALGLKSGALEKSDLKALADLLRLTLEPSRITHHASRTYQLLRSLHCILKS